MGQDAIAPCHANPVVISASTHVTSCQQPPRHGRLVPDCTPGRHAAAPPFDHAEALALTGTNPGKDHPPPAQSPDPRNRQASPEAKPGGFNRSSQPSVS